MRDREREKEAVLMKITPSLFMYAYVFILNIHFAALSSPSYLIMLYYCNSVKKLFLLFIYQTTRSWTLK